MSSSRAPPLSRRALGAGLILLALWVQALAPVAASRAASSAADPLRDAIICGHGLGGAEAGPAVEQPSPAVPACAPCRFCCAGIATPTLPGTPALSGSLRWRAVSWPIPPPARPGLVARYVGQPRAPPVPA